MCEFSEGWSGAAGARRAAGSNGANGAPLRCAEGDPASLEIQALPPGQLSFPLLRRLALITALVLQIQSSLYPLQRYNSRQPTKQARCVTDCQTLSHTLSLSGLRHRHWLRRPSSLSPILRACSTVPLCPSPFFRRVFPPSPPRSDSSFSVRALSSELLLEPEVLYFACLSLVTQAPSPSPPTHLHPAPSTRQSPSPLQTRLPCFVRCPRPPPPFS
ncbi:hypothetical protein K402DRAFT_130014 [Aulographum hederae CBS 113979]|uniref:Uncharacterized protein n=1 Tax=Aulographum hederae CBS 113979 TaxID=1176131 RepID=A0A6G1HEX5_9PEZI|nr:hypothetical protein K402DRAFT_130014 [Aulographum hederae CBS 113979]